MTLTRGSCIAESAHPAFAGFAFFFYGTLCDSDARAAVIGRALAAEPALLPDYEAVPVGSARSQTAGPRRFPILLFQRGRAAAGVICGGVSVSEAARLGFYEHEGRDYAARELAVRDGAGWPWGRRKRRAPARQKSNPATSQTLGWPPTERQPPIEPPW